MKSPQKYPKEGSESSGGCILYGGPDGTRIGKDTPSSPLFIRKCGLQHSLHPIPCDPSGKNPQKVPQGTATYIGTLSGKGVV